MNNNDPPRASTDAQALTMQYGSIQEWRHKTYEGVWDAQTRERERMKKAMLDEATEQWKQRRMKIDEEMKINEEKRIDKNMKNTNWKCKGLLKIMKKLWF